MRLFIGQKWAAMHVRNIEREMVKEQTSPGVVEQFSEMMATIDCDCGNTVHMPVKDFRAQKYMPDCGCGIAKKEKVEGRRGPGRPRVYEDRVHLSAQIPLEVMHQIRKYQREQDYTLSRTVTEILMLGFASLPD